MPFTFECGVCRSVYRLDEQQITPNGVKITCPKCLNFFILKRNLETTERPTVERIVSDGAHEIQTPPPPKGAMTADRLLSDSDLDPTEPISKKPSTPPKPSRPSSIAHPEVTLRVESGKIRKEELSDYPVETPPQGLIEQYFIPVSLILIIVSGLIYLNYEGIIRIPGLEKLRPPKPVVIETPTTVVPEAKRTKHGFPPVDNTYDPWSHAPKATASATPSNETSEPPPLSSPPPSDNSE